MISSIVYYFVFSSMLLVHGICFDWAFFNSEYKHIVEIPLRFLKNSICACSTTVLASLLVRGFFLDSFLTDIMPLVAMLIFAITALFCESLIRITAKRSAADLTVPLFCVLFALSETQSTVMAVLWCLGALVGYYLFILMLYALQKRLKRTSPPACFAEGSLLLISLAVIMLILFSLSTAWINPEVGL
jgi:hypothetical protein